MRSEEKSLEGFEAEPSKSLEPSEYVTEVVILADDEDEAA